MQIKVLHKNIYKLYSYSRTQEILDRYRDLYRKSVDNWGLLKSFGNGDELCQRFSGISRSTYFRRKKILNDLNKGIIPPSKRPKKVNEPRWRESELQHVLRIRRKNPTYGKAKISVILRRDHGLNISESSVGRILKHLMERGLVTKSLSSSRIKRKRCFKGHAKPCIFKDYKKMKLGERVQIDHMTVTKNGISFKHFQGWERQSKFIDAGIYGNAKSSSARKFLLSFVASAPFKILSIQVDGGSEFMNEFEKTCAELGIELLVLPPKSPKHNGGVERGNRIFREEFYARRDLLADSMGAMRNELKTSVQKYNSYRPHHALNGATPMEYINNNSMRHNN